VLALFVETCLLAIQILEREAIDRRMRVPRHPLLHGGERDGEQLGVEPGRWPGRLWRTGSGPAGAGVDLVVALVFVVLEPGEYQTCR